MANPTFGTAQQTPLTLYFGSGYYFTAIPLLYHWTTTSYTITLNNVHMPYHYDLPNYYMYIYNGNDFSMSSSNQFLMTSANVFYVSPLKSLTI